MVSERELISTIATTIIELDSYYSSIKSLKICKNSTDSLTLRLIIGYTDSYDYETSQQLMVRI